VASDVIAEETPAADPRKVELRKPPRRKPVKKSMIWLHRWLSLVLGAVLVVECATGSLLVYKNEIMRAQQGDVWAPTGDSDGENLKQSADAVAASDPDFVISGVNDAWGTHMVTSDDAGETINVDGETGEILGRYKTEGHPRGPIGWTVAFSYNLHLCALTCEGYPGYQEWLAKDVPKIGKTLGFEDDGEVYPVTWGGLILGVLAFLLLFLALTGIWLWWPTIKHFKRGVRVRFGKNRYARDYDLHQVVGMIAIPLLLMWAVTGMSYEFGFVEKAYYKALPGEATENALVVDEESTNEISFDEALTAAQEASGHDTPPLSYYVPYADDAAGYWDFWFAAGYDPWGESQYPGDREVQVDRHDANNVAVTYGTEDDSAAQTIYQDYNYPVHSGFFANAWIRIVWCVLGLVPLLLMWTGISTWLFKRATKKRRKKAARATAAAPSTT
jgi:uncharacterized iron-regulated membrane protein